MEARGALIKTGLNWKSAEALRVIHLFLRERVSRPDGTRGEIFFIEMRTGETEVEVRDESERDRAV